MLHRRVKPFLPSAFSGMDGSYERNLPGMLERPGCISHYPVMGMDQIEASLEKNLLQVSMRLTLNWAAQVTKLGG